MKVKMTKFDENKNIYFEVVENVEAVQIELVEHEERAVGNFYVKTDITEGKFIYGTKISIM